VGSRRLIFCLLILAAPGSVLVAGKGRNAGKDRVDLYGDPLPLWASARLGSARSRHKDFIRQIVYSDDGKLLATGSWRQVQVGSRHRAFKELSALAFSKDKRVLAVASRDFAADGISLVQFLNLATGNLENRDLREQECHILSLAYSPDGKTLAAAVQRGGERALVRLWNVAKGKGRTLCRFQHSSGIWNVAFSPDGATVACPGEDNTVCVVELAGGKIIHRFKGHENEVTAVIFAPDGKTLISGSKDRTIRLWDLETKKEKQCLEGHDGYVIHLNMSADGKVLASQDSNYGTRIWDTATGKEVAACRRAGEGSMALTPDGKLLALASARKSVDFWEVPTGREHAPRAGHRDTIVALAFSDDGATLASAGSDQTVRTWDPGTMKQLQTYQEKAELVAFSSGILILGDGKNRFWIPDKNSGKKVLPPKHVPVGLVNGKISSPDGRMQVQALEDGSVRLVEIASGQERRVFKGHADKVTAAIFSGNGKVLATGSADATILLWDIYGSSAGPLDPKKLESLWADLLHDDAAVAYVAVCALIQAPEQAVPYLKKQLQSVTPLSADRLKELLTELDSDRFLVRKNAMAQLQEALEDGRLSPGGFEKELRKKLAKGASLEFVRRGQQLLKILPGLDRSSRRLRQIRALEVLEHAGVGKSSKS